MKLYNSLSRKIEEFAPIDPPNAGMYTCGPTVYGPGHLGHARSYVNFDLLKRVLIYNGYKVTHVLNITDVHDDMIKKADEEGISILELADRYIPLFKKDMEDLNVFPADFYPRVTDHIKEIIEMIKILVDKGYAYVEKDGVYFDISKFKNYGKLSGRKPEKAKTGTRVQTDKYEKEEAVDFVLWKDVLASQEQVLQTQASWESPWGMGRPGWHIECSVMAKKYLGKIFDLHAGAMDLKFPHHENEIAQSEAANGIKFVNFWFHGGLLEVEGKKMSKSLGNFIEIHEIKEKGFEPLALRYLFLTVGYRDKLNFTWRGLEASQTALNNLRSMAVGLHGTPKNEANLSQNKLEELDNYRRRFEEAINNDLAVPQALAITWELVKSHLAARDKLELVLEFDRVLGLNLDKVDKAEQVVKVEKEIMDLVKKREELRKAGKWDSADQLRQQIEKAGFKVEDASFTTVLHRDVGK